MTVTPAQVKDLREKTGAGMMDCKRALAESAGDMEKAVETLRKQGLATAAKKAGRTAADGVIGWQIADDGSLGVLIEVNCETDFVTKTDGFQEYVARLTKVIAEHKPADMDQLMELTWDGGTVRDVQTGLVATIGEKLGARRFVCWQTNGASQKIAQYIHAGSKIGVMVRFADPSGKLPMELAREVAMHVAAMSPQYVRADQIPADVMAKEKEIFLAQMGEINKPPQVMEKIVEGKLAKFAKEVCLDDQIFVRDPSGKNTVAAILQKIDKDIRIDEFVRLQVGEGIEKKKE